MDFARGVFKELDSTTFFVKSDGSYTVEFEKVIRIIHDLGRDQHAMQAVAFNSHSSTFELIEASTDNDGSIERVAKSGVQNRDAGDSKGLSLGLEARRNLKLRVESEMPIFHRVFDPNHYSGDRAVDGTKSQCRVDFSFPLPKA